VSSREPCYLESHRSGILAARISEALERLRHCTLCPRSCEVNRLEGETGTCRTGRWARVASLGPHFGEEAPLVGRGGSGTIFFSNCNLLCSFCQNYDISHGGEGREVSDLELATMMLELQRLGCHNINLVTPSHVVPQILAALSHAIEAGLRVPLVYNSSGYDSPAALDLLDGVVDIYMPDFKFWNEEPARVTCGAPDYPEVARTALRAMHRQVGDLEMDAQGLAVRGLLVRHLVMPGDVAGTAQIMQFVSSEISANTYVNVMAQYRPCWQAHTWAPIARRVSLEVYREAVRAAREAGLVRLDGPSGW